MLLCTCLGLWVVFNHDLRTWQKYFFGGLLTGLSMAAKIHGVFYMIPLLVYTLTTEFSWEGWLLTLVVAFAAGFGLFLVDGVSFSHFSAWLREIARHELMLQQFWVNITYLVPFVYALPWRSLPRPHKIVYASLLACSLVIAVFASKVGAGPNHFIALYPLPTPSQEKI